ncbi:hypothetical protein [Xanthomonas cannabis]|uniref:phage nozzle protein n=1 Tax=Xanthomonas cannabis TaxID=1885674 RepID=UPI0033A20982
MSLETGSYPSFLGGVSQQDASVRNATQVTDAHNTWLHSAMGTGKRPAAQFVKVLGNDISPQAHFHSIVRDSVEHYLVAVESGKVRVFNHETGYEYDVLMAEGSAAYLATDKQPWSVFRTCTQSDTTFIVNTQVTTKMSNERAPGRITGSVQTFTDLPKPDKNVVVPSGAIYEVLGASGNKYDNFVVQRAGKGVWQEIARPGAYNTFDKTTMPHLLKRVVDPVHGDGLFFSFGPMDWDKRLAGDDTTIGPPSFIDEKIRDVFFHRGRLGLMSTENTCLSEIDHPFNFWRTTTQQLLDSDVIDFAVQSRGVAQLQFGVPFQSSLLMFGDRANFQMTADPMLTPKTPKVDELVNYECSLYVRPVLLGDTLYFASDSGSFSVLREYFVDDVSITGDAADVTAHVPRLIPGRLRAMAAVPGADALVVAPVDSPSQLYTYFVRWAGNEKSQSSWTRWDLSGIGRVVHLHSTSDDLYVTAESPAGGVELLRMSLSLVAAEGDFTKDYSFLLDRLVVVQPDYYAFGNYTDINLPYTLARMDGLVIGKTDDWASPGELVDLTGATLINGGMGIRFQGNLAAGRLAIGVSYDSSVELTRAYLRDQRNNSILVGRLQIRDITVAYKDAAYFEVNVITRGRESDPQTYLASHAGLFTARTLGDEVFRLGSPTFHSGERRFPVQARSDNCRVVIRNRLPFQCWLQSAQYRALFSSRSSI